MNVGDIRDSLDKNLRPESDDALNILSYHGIIDTNDPSNPKVAGTLFRTWFIEHTLDYKPEDKLLRAKAILKELSSDNRILTVLMFLPKSSAPVTNFRKAS